ncbi:hypothetical protein ACHHYP_20624 [Achlya hypogyna]|uniref:Uncharacterized protein n=1 Tax=Achlya hypogyna TaxID=1202772 RepID=A0A1V9YGL0_ACHHY|nr:hypothetical protein ACHHYP_20624 [Achlya hypogyna]
MAITVYNESNVTVNVLVVLHVLTPFPSKFMCSWINNLAPGASEQLSTYQGSCTVMSWPATDDSQISRSAVWTKNLVKAGIKFLDPLDVVDTVCGEVVVDYLVNNWVVESIINYVDSSDIDAMTDPSNPPRSHLMGSLFLVHSFGLISSRDIFIRNVGPRILVEQGWFFQRTLAF